MIDWIGVPEDITQYIGFIYCIRNIHTGRMYIGKKLFFSTLRRKPLKGKKRVRKSRKETDWRNYWSSCNELLADIKKSGEDAFRREILHCHKTRWEWSYAELKEQVNRDVLTNPIFYNGIIRIRLPAYKK